MNPRARKLLAHLNRAPEITRCAQHSRDWLRLSLSYTGLQQIPFPFTARFRDGQSFEFQDFYDLATWWQVFYRHVYPVHQTDRVIVDAGANIGAFTLYALARCPRAQVIAVEPFPATFVRLRAAIESSPFRARARLINAALAAAPGWVSMQQTDMGSQFRRVILDGLAAGSPANNPARVPALTLRELLETIPGDIDFLKMDVEGSEYATLLNCPPGALSRIRRLAMEFHPLYIPDAPKPTDLFQHLERAGLAAAEIQDHGEGYGMAYFRRSSP